MSDDFQGHRTGPEQSWLSNDYHRDASVLGQAVAGISHTQSPSSPLKAPTPLTSSNFCYISRQPAAPIHAMKSRAIALLLLLATARSAFSWGSEGHEIVALIALHDLTPTAKAKILQMFRTEDASTTLTLPELMMHASTWPDMIKSHPSTPISIFKDIQVLNAAQSHPLHFVNLDGPHFNPATDCPNSQCAVSAIARCREVLADPTKPQLVRLEALKFLVHFVGDVHQPLHAGRRSDKGGNDIKIASFLGSHPIGAINLHEVWDKLIIQKRDKDANRYAKLLLGKIKPAARAKLTNNVDTASWVEDSHKLAMGSAYLSAAGTPLVNGDSIDEAYYKRALPIVEKQLQRAGVRLAAVINGALEK